MGEDLTSPQIKYIHGNYGKGTFTFKNGRKIKGQWVNGNLVN